MLTESIRRAPPVKALIKLVFFAALYFFAAMVAPSIAHANEILTDRCSSDVVIAPTYNAPPNAYHAIVLVRDVNGSTPWSPPFKIELDSDSGFIRWWCHSTAYNWLDPGTWRIDELILGIACNLDGSSCHPSGLTLKGHTASTDGWTAERSRCDSHTNVLRARLGPDRLLQMECLPSDQGVAMQSLSSPPAATPSLCVNTVQNVIAWDYYGDKVWDPSNVNALCAGAETSQEPGWCFLDTMFDGVDWGGGTQWYWGNASNLCAGTRDAASTVGCFKTMISRGYGWPDAISLCRANYRPITISGYYLLDIASLDDWRPVVLAYRSGGSTQLWQHTPVGELRNSANPEQCLDVRYGATDLVSEAAT